MNDDIQRDPVTKVEAFPLAGRLPQTLASEACPLIPRKKSNAHFIREKDACLPGF
ncbi:hypothetical protein [Amantichitinum ursilacus]|uniref:Uncharacterized protein n=1 Tax=Amantichitinum ursilacus TaxID=857265 RepID=A0A0N1JT73_9NEIS|nr:hypothetical protein [Amantichitinum ursilacus]KPC53776.1 hypothetical protein WG78_08030 [Amantichitinum ursilacus]